MKLQKPLNLNNGRAIHFTWLEATFIPEEHLPDGSNSSNIIRIPSTFRMKEAKSWRSKVNMILKIEDS